MQKSEKALLWAATAVPKEQSKPDRDYSADQPFEDAGWPNIPTEIELTRVDGALMSGWNWQGLPYIVKFNFMYLTEVCTEPGEKEEIYAHLRGLWQHSKPPVSPSRHWGKINFIDLAFVRRNHDLDARKDVYELVVNRAPVIASHIGVQSMNEVPYNLSEEDVRAIAASGGVVGIIFMPY